MMRGNLGLVFAVAVLTATSVIVLQSIVPFIFPQYYFYIALGIVMFIVFSFIDFSVLSAFSPHLYVASIVFLLLPFLVGQVTRGVVRWVGVGELTIQPSEIVRPFLILFYAVYLAKEDKVRLTAVRTGKALIFLFIPFILILLQPSLGVAVLTLIGFFGVFLSLNYDKKILPVGMLIFIIALPVFWLVLAPYQKLRVITLINPMADPYGAGYNSIQSVITIGSGGVWGKGLGKGVQTQLEFLPERHTDFIFASIAEEMGLVGALFVLLVSFFLLYQIIVPIQKGGNYLERAFLSGIFLTLFTQVAVHVGMNMGLAPITGLPLPLVSAGGSSYLATMIMLGIVARVRVLA
ncbi:MAG: Rod shape-determining protein RodA [Candidatus Woesebacteria bacterium GW2011_GWB1_43_14]|uniref:Probable peptidoglycan glycosyltransferase FtsW n=1 Tax=Candidatus Woesebacteria bacterium GW2011_GWB1_43_14 TaxID=1618578 RepID=A0A0G1DHI5_9BACT|nr:MAG: Rod shape-determining protein RodA [Candidatus Woesebacteria bacterium GW2011_GWA1_39_11b]KKS78445.1 MAG: Rod shape-determining protein RodA [Candidatus Woesebacteria bacterium GW2011_GWC1_42_9]KKS97139.1 MAG: Rod shape-determining protein RodA [Candidatus Woesebacteria bacterium GW2011_GWB1_43_14]